MTVTAHAWDKAVVKGNEWLTRLGGELNWANPRLTLFALRSVLHTIRDRLPPDEAVELAAQMPLIIKGLYFDGWDPSATPVKTRTKAEFLAVVSKRLKRAILEVDPERVTRAVFTLMAERISEGELRDVRGILPAEIAELWPTPAKAS
ncbi:MAG TPA: DUF2267 domain-containing protein [Gemmatimonadales bacterium]|nr:DUF2267 domain-containing protein [Gemmatimonadales bacterium]